VEGGVVKYEERAGKEGGDGENREEKGIRKGGEGAGWGWGGGRC